jgi:hypothetical protein
MAAIIIAPGIPEPNLVYETYVCSGPDGLEYGFTFKQEGSDDSEFDMVLGVVPNSELVQADAITANAWRTHEWAAKAIVEAAPQRPLMP